MAASNPLKIIDISQTGPSTPAELLDALTTQGFVFVDGHDFTQEEVDSLFDLSRAFFQLPSDYKQRYSIVGNTGYITFTKENLDPAKKDDFKEGLNLSDLDLATGELNPAQLIPDWIKDDDARYELIKSSIRKLNSLNLKLLESIAVALEIEDSGECAGAQWFTSRYDPKLKSGSTLRFLHYPVLNSNNSEGEIRAGAHTDYGSMTLLFQRRNQEGLEIYSPISKRWEKVPYVETENTGAAMAPPIVMNIGDLLSYWTAGLLKSTIHRVKFDASESRKEDRYSIVFFSHPSDETLLEPVPSPLIRARARSGRGVTKDEAKGEFITALEHLQRKLAPTYQ
ncbi:uncharacterized protein LODBEIA_P34100 [Lodderomyces beijingensis]|uniref:Fe2OG dioxygenase domain-containing protein n=1 Tax=Lodderomyces beijingensis TaxID=1775926 RepID=A0ABP0ZQ06_9ASCO